MINLLRLYLQVMIERLLTWSARRAKRSGAGKGQSRRRPF